MHAPYSPPVITSLGFRIAEKASKLRNKNSMPPLERRDRIVVVNNDPASRRLLSVRLGAAGYEVESVNDARAALDACMRARPNLVITDLRMREMDGLGLLNELKVRWPGLSVIMLTAHGTIPEAVQATRHGAFGFLVDPVAKAELLGQVQRAIAASTITHVNGEWRADIVSRCQLMEDRLTQANKAAGTDSPVMLTGEGGTGRELFARAIHAASARSTKPFIAISCQGKDEHLLEEELFGSASDAGAFRAARGGTLLIHEICNLPLRLQAEFVNALQEDGQFGGAHSPAAAVRLICTTSRDLKQAMTDGLFRQDLYYRIHVFTIEVPPLGRRREDIPLLVSHFLAQATDESGFAKMYSPKAVALLMTADWPGNVRQLFDFVKQNVVVSPGKMITEDVVQQSLGQDCADVPSYDDARDKFLRDYLVNTLRSTAGNVSKSARLVKRNRTDFYKLMARYRILANDFKRTASR
jgi:two-component system response regulator GlrR